MIRLTPEDLENARRVIGAGEYLDPASIKRAQKFEINQANPPDLVLADVLKEIQDATKRQHKSERRQYEPIYHSRAGREQAILPSDRENLSLHGNTKDFRKVLDCPNLSSLSIYKLSKSNFGIVSQLTNLRSLAIRDMRSDDLQLLGPLSQLEHLALWQCSVKSLSGLEALQQLVTLNLAELSSIREIDRLSSLTSLRGLALSTGIGIKMEIQSLKPLQHLRDLRDLTLSLRVVAEDYELLTNLELDHISIPVNIPVEKIALLCVSFPSILKHLVDIRSWSFRTCRRCDQENVVWLFGKGRRSYCVTCEKEKLELEWKGLFSKIDSFLSAC